MPADVIDYRLIGDDLQAVIITLDPGEAAVAEAGSMMYMEDDIQMATTLDATGQGGSLWGKLLQGGKRLLTGDSFFVTMFANNGRQRRDVAFASPYPGKILPVDLKDWGGTIIAQKDSFLCGARGLNVSIAFTKRIGAGFFGGEGFIMQKLEGDGMAFIHASGTLMKRDLAPGELLRVDTGCLVGLAPSVQYDIEYVGKIKTALFGGEGLFFAALRGPGTIYLQSLPFSRLASRVFAAAPQRGGSREEGSMLGGFAAGGLLGGLWMVRLGINRALWIFGVVQYVTIAGFLWLAVTGPFVSVGASERALLAVVIGAEAVGVGVGTAAFVAYIARATSPAYTATQFALFTSLAAVPRTFLNAATGWLVGWLGWPSFFWLCMLLAIPGMVLVVKVAPWDAQSPRHGGGVTL